MCFKREGCLITLCHEKGRLSFGIDFASTTQLCLRKRPFSTSDLFQLLTSGEKSGLGLFEDCLGVDGDFDQVADYTTVSLERGVPAYAEVLAVYRGLGRKASASLGALVHAIVPPRGLPLT